MFKPGDKVKIVKSHWSNKKDTEGKIATVVAANSKEILVKFKTPIEGGHDGSLFSINDVHKVRGATGYFWGFLLGVDVIKKVEQEAKQLEFIF